MEASLGSELVHLRCGNCGQITSLSLQALEASGKAVCAFCGSAIGVDLDAAERDASREAHELDSGDDALGSTE